MLNFLKKKKKNVELYAPVTGKSINLEDVPDKVFASKMMGEGIAFKFDTDTICSPCDGELTVLANTLHAFGIKADNGAEILVHIGLDTVNLGGKGFTSLVSQGDTVKKGDPIIKIDRDVMNEQGIDLTTPVIVTNSSEFDFTVSEAEKNVTMGVDIIVSFN